MHDRDNNLNEMGRSYKLPDPKSIIYLLLFTFDPSVERFGKEDPEKLCSPAEDETGLDIVAQ